MRLFATIISLRGKALLIAAAIAAVSVPFSIGIVRAQTESRPEAPPNIVGDYIGVFSGPGLPEGLTAKLQVKADAGGKLSGTLEFPGAGRVLPLTDIRVEGQSLSFAVPIDDDRWKDSFGDSWKGSIENSGARLNGAFTWKASMQLNFTRETAQTPTRPETPQTQLRPEALPSAILPAGNTEMGGRVGQALSSGRKRHRRRAWRRPVPSRMLKNPTKRQFRWT
jgi:hypothetical protein